MHHSCQEQQWVKKTLKEDQQKTAVLLRLDGHEGILLLYLCQPLKILNLCFQRKPLEVWGGCEVHVQRGLHVRAGRGWQVKCGSYRSLGLIPDPVGGAGYVCDF